MAIESSIWIYWFCSLLVAGLLIGFRQKASTLLSPTESDPGKGYGLWLGLGWLATLLAAGCYVLFTHKMQDGSYSMAELTIFSLLNGILEQLMFVGWFVLGCWLGRQLGLKRSGAIFAAGFVSYALYSGAIHALFWFPVLPSHVPAAIMPPILLAMSLLWMWLLWRYRAILAIIVMHIAIDFVTIGHLHFPWFTSLG